MHIYNIKDIDFSKIKLENPKKTNNVYYSNIIYNDNPLIVKVDDLKVLNDLSDISNKTTPSIEFEILNMDLYDFLIEIDEYNINETFNNEQDWFIDTDGNPKNIPKEMIDDMYKRLTKPLKLNQQPTIRFKLPVKSNTILCKCYGDNNDIISIDSIKENTNVSCIINIRGLKFLKQHFICDCYISQIKINNYTNSTNYIIPSDCLLNNDSNYNSDEDIIDNNELLQIEYKSKLKKILEELNNKENELEELHNTETIITSEIEILKDNISKLQQFIN